MKIRISTKTRKIIIIYLLVLVAFYLAIYVVPKVTHIFETTQVLETGSLQVSCETTGYIVKDETVNTADGTGELAQGVIAGTVVKKGTEIVSIKESDKADEDKDDKDSDISSEYKKYLKRLKSYDALKDGCDAPISGVCSYTIDGYEGYFAIDNLDKIKKSEVEKMNFDTIDLNRDSAVKGEPVFKISRDDNWYVLCWLDKEDAQDYTEGMEVTLEFPEGEVPAVLHSISRKKDEYRVTFYVNSYYQDFASTRSAEITIIQSNTTGLIVDNECIIKKDKQTGVYVKDKDGDYSFKPVKIKASDGKQSSLYDGTFTNDDYEQVETVNVYDEVLRHPDSTLERDLEKESKDKTESSESSN